MDWDEFAKIATVLGGATSVITALIALAALIYARRQIHAAREIAKEGIALTAYREYLRVCFDHSEFSCSKLAKVEAGVADWKGIEGVLTPKSEKYLWMVSILLNTCEQVLAAEPDEPIWRQTLRKQLSYHRPLLAEVWPTWSKDYGDAMHKLVDG